MENSQLLEDFSPETDATYVFDDVKEKTEYKLKRKNGSQTKPELL